MTPELFQQIIATYRHHGWELQSVLLRPDTRALIATQAKELFAEAALRDDEIDALWFARPSHAGREAWELRLVAEQAYALFESFEADMAEEEKEEKLKQMEEKMRAHVAG